MKNDDRRNRIADLIRQLLAQDALPRCKVLKFPERRAPKALRDLRDHLNKASSNDE